jgi:prophage maintenance system killer protein/prophage antirepressor-like protein
MVKENEKRGEIVIYTLKKGSVDLKVKLENETIWLTQSQIAELFGIQRPAITKHLNNIFKEGELNKDSVCSILEHTASDRKTYKIQFYNLDAILSVGYRVNSKRATQFRIWATNILKKYLIEGYVVNQKRILSLKEKQLRELSKTLSIAKKTAEKKLLSSGEAIELLKIISDYANSWEILEKYDKGELKKKIIKDKKDKWILEYDFSKKAVDKLRKNLISKKQASDLFGKEREEGSLEKIVGAIYQSYGGKSLYINVKEKASHLFYFVIKDHPFIDGNKRSASLLFILFLSKNNLLFRKNGEKTIGDSALTALALLVAESNPKDKEIMINLIINLIG